MNKLIMAVMLAAIALASGGAAANAGNNGGQPVPTIVALGDSLTEGYGLDPADAYPAQLERKLHADGHACRVVNAGVSGETSRGALSRINWILKLKPQIVILETGANDGLRGIDPRFTRDNIGRIVEILQSHNVRVILAGMAMTRNLGASFTREFAAIYPWIAEKYNLASIPFFLEDVATVPQLNLADGIHPNARGYAKVVENVYPYVVEALGQLGQ